MAISLSFVLVFGIAVWVLHKYAGLKVWHGVICVLFGFYLAASTLAPEIRPTLTPIIHAPTGQGCRPRPEGVIITTEPKHYAAADLREAARRHDSAASAMGNRPTATAPTPL